MSKKIQIALCVAALVGLIATLSSLNVSAQGPANTYPGAAQYVDGQWRTIPGNSSLWFIFDYSGDLSEIFVMVTDGAANHLEMNVFTPEQVRFPDIINGNPIGRGLPPKGSVDLSWSAKMYIAGTYFVQVVNGESNAKLFQLKVSGRGVTVREPTATPTLRAPATATFTRTRAPGSSAASPNAVWTSMAVFAATMKAPPPKDLGTIFPTLQPSGDETITPTSTPTSTPTVTLTPAPTRIPAAEFLDANNFYPQTAAWVYDSRERIVLGKSSLWFKFLYAGDGSLAEIKIPEGSLRKLAFKVFDGNQINLLGLNAPAVGQGSSPLVNCSGVRCPSVDLMWSSKFPGPGTIYIQVLNDNPGQVNFNLVVTGSGTILGQ